MSKLFSAILFFVSFYELVLSENFAVVGYLPEYRLHNFDYEGAFALGLTHLIFFSLEINKNGLPAALDRLPQIHEVKRARHEADKVGGKLLISFGGNARSQNFGFMTKEKGRRTKFLASLQELLNIYGLDGVDYNWEYPASVSEWENWKKLMKATRALQLTKSGISKVEGGASKRAIVTFTMYLDSNHYGVIQQHDLLSVADYVHCMAYDARAAEGHSTIPFAQKGLELAQQTFGHQAHKFTLGLPFYGRSTVNMEPAAFYDLAPKVKDNSTDVLGQQFFNSQETLAHKIELAHAAGVGGVMIWELGQDRQPFLSHPDSLMQGVYAGLLRIRPGLQDPNLSPSGSGSDIDSVSEAVDVDVGVGVGVGAGAGVGVGEERTKESSGGGAEL